MKLRRDAGLFQREVTADRSLGKVIIMGQGEKGRRGVFVHGRLSRVGAQAEGGIDDYREVRSIARLVVGINLLIRALIGIEHGVARYASAGGETNHADALRLD